MVRAPGQGELDGVVGRRVAGVQRGDDVDVLGQRVGTDRLRHRGVDEGHVRKPEPCRQCARLVHQVVAPLDAMDVGGAFLQEQVVEDEAEIGFAGSVIDQGERVLSPEHLVDQGFDEMAQVIHLLELAAAVLVESAVAGEDVQFLQQFDRLPRAQHVGERIGERRLARAALHVGLSRRTSCCGKGIRMPRVRKVASTVRVTSLDAV